MTKRKTNKKTHEETHPWINFILDLRNFSFNTWLLLGEAQSKCEHIADTPLTPEVANQMYQLYLAKGVNATTAIEGNTLTIDEVQKRIRGELSLPPSKEYLGKEIDNIVQTCNQIKDAILSEEITNLTTHQICKYNAQILKDLILQDDVVPGKVREYEVIVGPYKGVRAQDCEFLLNKLCDWINSDWAPPGNHHIAFGIIKAIITHLYLAWIHPFGDGNGRTARMLEFQILFSLGIPAAATHLISNHYNQTRSEYYRHLDEASRTENGIYAFIEYALQGFVDGLREQIRWIKGQQLYVHWINYIHDYFRDKTGNANNRRKHLLIDLSSTGDFVPLGDVKLISKRVMESYKNKSDKTFQRDIDFLQKEGLIQVTAGRIRSCPEIILAFRSPKVRKRRK